MGIPLAITVIGLGAIVLLAGVYVALPRQNEVGKRISDYIEAPHISRTDVVLEGDSTFTRVRRQFNLWFGGFKSEELQQQLAAANWPISASEYWFIRVGSVALTFLVTLMIIGNVLPALGLAVLVYLTPGFFLFRSIQARQKLFQNQLIDALTLIRGAVEAGYSFQQAFNVVIQEMDPPTSEEFRLVRREVELGLPLSRALYNMAGRMESDDFYLVMTAVNINMQTGGNLVTILNVVIETIRQRIFLYSELRALTSYARLASYILTLLPILTIAALSFLSPLYWERLLTPGITRYILIYAAVSIIVGNIFLRRISKIQV